MSDVRERAIQAGTKALAGMGLFPANEWSEGALHDCAEQVLEAEGVAYFDLIDTLAALVTFFDEGGNGEGWSLAEFIDAARALLARLGGNT